MSFLDPDDYFLVMYYPPKQFELGIKTLSKDNLKCIREAGAKTVLIQTDWSMLEPKQGEYHWDHMDEMVQNASDVGMKILMQEYVFGPYWCPPEWYLQSATTKNPENNLSIWNQDAQDYLMEWDILLHKRYPEIHLVCSQGIVGESYLPFTMEYPFCDPAAVESRSCYKDGDEWLKDSVIDVMVGRNRLLLDLNTNKEIWHSAHHTLATNPELTGTYRGCGAEFIRDVLDAEKKEFPGVKFNGIQYTYWFEGSNNPVWPDYRRKVREDRDQYGIDFFVEAGYCQGLPVHTPKLIAEGHRGFILAPLSPCTEDRQFEGWMADNIRNSYNALNRRGQ